MRTTVVVLVVLLSACAAEKTTSDELRATCGDFFGKAHPILVDDPPGTPQDKVYRCAVELDPALVLPGTVVPVFSIGGHIFPLLEYPKPSARPSPDNAYRGVFAFRGDAPERHPNEQCEWVEIDIASCSLY